MDIFGGGDYSAHTGCHQEGEHKNRLYGEGEVSSEQVELKCPWDIRGSYPLASI